MLCWAGTFELMQEPQALLCEGQRDDLRAWLRTQGRAGGTAAIQLRCQLGHGGLEQRLHRQLHIRATERMRLTRRVASSPVAAQIEEAIIDTHTLQAQDIGKQVGPESAPVACAGRGWRQR